jgi:hypothetical protein
MALRLLLMDTTRTTEFMEVHPIRIQIPALDTWETTDIRLVMAIMLDIKFLHYFHI